MLAVYGCSYMFVSRLVCAGAPLVKLDSKSAAIVLLEKLGN